MIAIDYHNLCLSCMEERGAQNPCSACGFPAGGGPESALHLPPGTVLQDKYVIGRALGQGGFGITYLAWDSRLKLKLAVKEYLPQQLVYRTDADTAVNVYKTSLTAEFSYGREKFLEEAQTLARFIDHPNIVSVRDYFEANGTAYLVMNYHEGVTLHAYLQRRGGSIEAGQAVKIFMPVLDALKEVHGVGILHRDISPDNLLIDKNGRVILIDFGAARLAMGEKSRSLSVVMKAGYSPEEQYRSHGRQGPWTDIYAVAATLYRAVTGQAPPESMDRLADDDLVPPSRLGVPISFVLEQTLLKALAVKAEERFQSVEEFQTALIEAGAGGRDKVVYPGVDARKPVERAARVDLDWEQGNPVAAEEFKWEGEKKPSQAPPNVFQSPPAPHLWEGEGVARDQADASYQSSFAVSKKPFKFNYAAIIVGVLLLFVGGISLIGVGMLPGAGHESSPDEAETPSAEDSATGYEPALLVGLDADYYIDSTGGTTPIGDLPIGARVVDPSWEWIFRQGINFSDIDYNGNPTPPGEVKSVTWIVVAHNHYDLEKSHVTLLTEELIGLFAFDDSTNRGHQDQHFGHNHWKESGTTNATRGLRPWLNSEGIHSGEGFYHAFSDHFKSAVLTTKVQNREWFNGDVYTTTDDVFIPSTTELGDLDHAWTYRIGTTFPLFTGATDEHRVALLGGRRMHYWLRSPFSDFGYSVRNVSSNGELYHYGFRFNYTNYGGNGVRPALNLKSEILVSEINP